MPTNKGHHLYHSTLEGDLSHDDRHTHKHRYVSRGLRVNVLIREETKVYPSTDVRAMAAPFPQLFQHPKRWSGRESNPILMQDRLTPYQLGQRDDIIRLTVNLKN